MFCDISFLGYCVVITFFINRTLKNKYSYMSFHYITTIIFPALNTFDLAAIWYSLVKILQDFIWNSLRLTFVSDLYSRKLSPSNCFTVIEKFNNKLVQCQVDSKSSLEQTNRNPKWLLCYSCYKSGEQGLSSRKV